MTLPDGKPGPRPVPPRRLVVRAGRRGARDATRAGASHSGACARRSSPPSASTACTRTTRGRGRPSRTSGAAAVPGTLTVTLSSDPSLFVEPQTVVARSNGAVVGRVRLRPVRARASASVPVGSDPGNERLPRRLHGRRRRPFRPRSRAVRIPTRGCSVRTSTASSTSRRSEDRVRRVAALAPAARDRELHPGLARRSRRGVRGQARDRRLRADEHPRPRADPRRARGDRRRAAHVAAALLARGANGLEPARPPGGRAAPRRVRRAALLRLDVSAAARRASARRRSTTSCRSTIPSGRPRGRARCTAASTGTPPRRATSSS